MVDLNAVLFYKSKFNIRVTDPSYDLLWEFVWLIKSWISSKYPYESFTKDKLMWSEFKIGNARIQSDDGKKLYSDSVFFSPDDTKIYWACRIIESPAPKTGFAPRKWTTELGFVQTNKESAEISCVLSYQDTPRFIGPCEDPPKLTFPKLMRYMLKSERISCFNGEDDLSLEPILLQAGDYKSFFDNRLWNPNRRIPYLLVCPVRDEEGNVKLPIDPKDLAVAVAMNATVFYASDMDFQTEMQYFIYPDYLCYPGSIRLYLPNMNPTNPIDSTKHRFLTLRNIEEFGIDSIARIFRRALAQEIHHTETLFRFNDCIDMKNEFVYQKKLLTIKQKAANEIEQSIHAAKVAANDDALEVVSEIIDEKEILEHENRVYREQIKEIEEENYNLRSQLDAMQPILQNYKTMQSVCEIQRNLRKLPSTAQEVCNYFEDVYSDRIAFTVNGRKSLRECYTQINLLWEALFNMSTTLYNLYFIEGSPVFHKAFQEETGWECSRGEGSNTHKDSYLMRQYSDNYEGRDIDIETHIKNGYNESDPKFIRIYFGFDKISEKIIIGSCGKHKENATSRKVK